MDNQIKHPRSANGNSNAKDDPTRNVLDLVNAAIERQDDLRSLDGRWRDRLDAVRAQHFREIRKAEADRLDSIRAVDQANIQQDKIVAEARATTLSNTVAATAAAFDAKIVTELTPIKKDIADTTQFRFEAFGGKAQVKEGREKQSSNGMWIGIGIAVASLMLSLAIVLSRK